MRTITNICISIIHRHKLSINRRNYKKKYLKCNLNVCSCCTKCQTIKELSASLRHQLTAICHARIQPKATERVYLRL